MSRYLKKISYPAAMLLPAVLFHGWAMCAVAPLFADNPWVEYSGREGPGQGRHIVFVTGDDEYRSEEGMPMLAKILAVQHGFRCSVLFAIHPKNGTITPDFQNNIPGTQKLDDADLMVLFTRFRELPDEQMKPIVDYTNSGKPMMALRTATHPFDYQKNKHSVYAKYTWNSHDPPGGFGQLVFGDSWVSHHGQHGTQSTRGIINESLASHPVLTGCDDIWGPTDVYGIVHLPPDVEVLLWGQVIAGMQPTDPPVDGAQNNPMMPLAWVRNYQGETEHKSRVFCTTMGAAVDLESAGLRRLLVNACYWSLGMEDELPAKANVDVVGTYKPNFYGFGKYEKGVKPADHALPTTNE